ncbi:MAG: hypothetical protein JSW12_00850 [Deltaproteobacteria bacterium]|nr:MAG: hypothetical protein JSW12_00850 [Deltaproteobacteria bacterium]
MRNSVRHCLFLTLSMIMSLWVIESSVAQVTLEVLNPRGEIEPPKTLGISPRVTDLAGKTIGLYDNGKQGFTAFLDVTEKLLKEKYPTATIKRYRGAFDLGRRLTETIANEVDTIIYGSGD